MIRDIYVVTTRYDIVKGVCEAQKDAEKLASIVGNEAKIMTVPFFPAYGYMKLGGVEDE